MRFKQIETRPKTFVIILDTGDEILKTLKTFAQEQKLSGSSFKAIGALSHVKFGWFDWQDKRYQVAGELDEQVELLSLLGDIAVQDHEPQIHAHVVVGRKDGTAHGGHLMEGRVRPTCEIVLSESPTALQKQIEPESGLPLIRV
jgi:hypothetical protein